MIATPSLRRFRPMRASGASAVALALIGTPAPAIAAGGLKMSPSRIDVAAERGDRLPPVTFANGTNRPIVLDLDHASVGQQLSGLPEPDPDGRRFLRLAPAKIRLAPGEQRVVRATVIGGPTRGIGAYGVITATTAPSSRSDSATISNRLRLAGTVLLRFPGTAQLRGRVTAVRVEQGAPRVLRVFGRVHNSGNLHTKPQARLTVRDAAGKAVYAASMPTGNVIPDADRELVGEIRRILPAGDYTARMNVRMGEVRSSRSTRFTLVGPNLLPTPKLRIVGLTTPRPEDGDAVEAAVTVRNTGTAAIAPAGVATLAPAGGGEPSAREAIDVGNVKPGMTTERRLSLPAIRSGQHELKVQFLDGDRVIAERTATFALTERTPWTARVMDWIAAHLPLAVGAVALTLLLLVAVVLMRLRHLKQRLAAGAPIDRDHVETVLAPPPATLVTAAAEPAPAPTTASVIAEPTPQPEPSTRGRDSEWVATVPAPPAAETTVNVARRRTGGLVGKLRNLR